MKNYFILPFFLLISFQSSFGVNISRLYYIDNGGYYLTAIDSDHDDLLEMYIFRGGPPSTTSSWAILEHAGNNDYFYQTLNPPDSSSPGVAGYIDEDSLADVVGRYWYGPIAVWETPDYFSYVRNLVWIDTVDTANAWDTYITDLDQDGKKEILCKARRDYTVRIYECAGDNNYQLVYKHSVWDAGLTWGYTGGIAYGDWDQDGKMEFCHADDGAVDQVAEVFIYENTAVGVDSYALVHVDSVFTKGAYNAAQANDMDGDGKPEFIIGGRHNDGTDLWDDVINIFEATGNNAYASSWNVILQTALTTGLGANAGDAWDVKTGDVDGDSIAEVIIATSESLIVYKAFGDNNYQRIYQGLTGPGDYNCRLNDAVLLCYDLNQNGYDEIVVSGYYYIRPSGTTEYYETRIYEISGEITWDSLKASPKDSCIQVQWSTSRQFACFGFAVYRSTFADSNYSIVHETNDTIRLDTTLLNYTFNDSNVATGTTYYYKVQAKALNDSTLFFGPVWVTYTGVSGRPVEPVTVYSFKMGQNAPNPFTRATTIKYQIPKEGNVSLKIYNIAGQMVKRLVDGTRPAGEHRAIWDGKDDAGKTVSGGVYFYRLKTGVNETTKRMSLLK